VAFRTIYTHGTVHQPLTQLSPTQLLLALPPQNSRPRLRRPRLDRRSRAHRETLQHRQQRGDRQVRHRQGLRAGAGRVRGAAEHGDPELLCRRRQAGPGRGRDC
jgi:hypothetical protein